MRYNLDLHHNVFYQYRGYRNANWNSNFHEDNVTKAIINSLESLSIKKQLRIFNKLTLLEIVFLPGTSIKYSLQSKPLRYLEAIHDLPENKKKLIGINPNGDLLQENVFKLFQKYKSKKNSEGFADEYIELFKGNEYFDMKEAKEEAKDQFNNLLVSVEEHGSKPDAWILVFDSENKLLACAVFEFKKFALFPDQLNRHMEQSLGIVDSKIENALRLKYSDIFNELIEYQKENKIVKDCLEILEVLGYDSYHQIRFEDIESVKLLSNQTNDNDDELNLQISYLRKKIANQLNDFLERAVEIEGVSIKAENNDTRKQVRILVDNTDGINITLEIGISSEQQFVILATELFPKYFKQGEKFHGCIVNHPEYIETIDTIYNDCTFNRHIRIRRSPKAFKVLSYPFVGQYGSFKDMISSYKDTIIYHRKMTYDALLNLSNTRYPLEFNVENQIKSNRNIKPNYNLALYEYSRIAKYFYLENYIDNREQLIKDLIMNLRNHVKGLRLCLEIIGRKI